MTDIEISGTVQFIPLEGGFYVIRSKNGDAFDPINLPEAYRRHGLKVNVEARIREDLLGLHLAGPIIEISSIHLL
jgi:hypothetical protein